MGKTKQAKEKRFDRNVEISAPILDPEIVKAIHSPPKGFDIKHAGFKALLSDLNSQDSTDELQPLNENHVPSYIGISCAVSGYSNYSPYVRRPDSQANNQETNDGSRLKTPNISRTASPVSEIQSKFQVHHIKLDKSHVQSADEERKELTELITASASDHRRSPSPCIRPIENDRHHGAYVGARYFPMPPPTGVVHKHIPLLGIDDDLDPEQLAKEEPNKVEEKIADLYGDGFVDDWRQSQSHKQKREIPADEDDLDQKLKTKNPKDLVTLRPTPVQSTKDADSNVEAQIDVPTPNIKVLEGVEKQFLNKLLTDENPPVPIASQERMLVSSPTMRSRREDSKQEANIQNEVQTQSPVRDLIPNETSAPVPSGDNTDTPISTSAPETAEPVTRDDIIDLGDMSSFSREDLIQMASNSPVTSPRDDIMQFSPEPELIAVSPDDRQQAEVVSPPMSPDSGKSQSIGGEDDLAILSSASGGVQEEHIEYEIKADSPIPNQSSPVRAVSSRKTSDQVNLTNEPDSLVNLSSNVAEATQITTTTKLANEKTLSTTDANEPEGELITSDDGTPAEVSKNGQYYLQQLAEVEESIRSHIKNAEAILEIEESSLDEDSVGLIRSAIGKANLLLNKKCNQFRGLCQANLDKTDDQQFATLDDDLAGFWDMVLIQVEELRKLFNELRQARERNWLPLVGGEASRKAPANSSPTTPNNPINKPKLSAQKDQKRRERLMEHINQAKQQVETAGGDVFDNVMIATGPAPALDQLAEVTKPEQQEESQLIDMGDVEDDSQKLSA